MTGPVKFKIGEPTDAVPGWTEQESEWRQLNLEAGGNPDFSPLVIKGAYVIGVIHDLFESVDYLLRHKRARETTYIPAYGVFASAIDLLGRCNIRGNRDFCGSTDDLKTGLKGLALKTDDDITALGQVQKTHVLVTTTGGPYTVGKLAALRHFSAHGQATSKRATC